MAGSSDRPYSRHYWELVDDEKFAEIYPDDHHYATWSRLLMIADQAWPASAHLPATARKASVTKLAEVGLIDLLPDGRFRMHGLEAERRARSLHAQVAAEKRWGNAKGNAPSTPRAMRVQSDVECLDETSIDEHRRDEHLAPAPAREADAAVALEVRTGRWPSPGIRTVLDEFCEKHGGQALVAGVISRTPMRPDEKPLDYVKRVQADVEKAERSATQAELAAEKRKVKAQHAPAMPVLRTHDDRVPTPEELAEARRFLAGDA